MRKLLSTPRLVILITTFVVFMSIYVAALYKLQIIEGAKYYAQSQNSIVTTAKSKAKFCSMEHPLRRSISDFNLPKSAM